MRDRMVAARMAVPFLQEVELGKRPKLPKSIKRQSLNEMAAFVAGKPDRASRRMSKAGSGGRALRVIRAVLLEAELPRDVFVGWARASLTCSETTLRWRRAGLFFRARLEQVGAHRRR